MSRIGGKGRALEWCSRLNLKEKLRKAGVFVAAAVVVVTAVGRGIPEKSSVAARRSCGTGGTSSAGFKGARSCDLLRVLEPMRLRMKPPMEEVLLRPRGSASRESEESDMEVSGRACSSMTLEMEEIVELRFMARGVGSVGVLGGTMPSRER